MVFRWADSPYGNQSVIQFIPFLFLTEKISLSLARALKKATKYVRVVGRVFLRHILSKSMNKIFEVGNSEVYFSKLIFVHISVVGDLKSKSFCANHP